MSGLLSDLERWNARGGVMVTVVEAVGSTPRGTGAYMIVDTDGALACGTIGGGALEYEAIGRAQAMLDAAGAASLEDVPLGPELGQCCGGRVSLLLERLPVDIAVREGVANPVIVTALSPPFARRVAEDHYQVTRPCVRERKGGLVAGSGAGRVLVQPAGAPSQPLAVFGAGHVGRAVVRAMAPLPFAIRWIDSRAALLPAQGDPGAEIVVTAAPADRVGSLDPGSFLLVMTHSHALDFEIVRKALARDDLGYVGLIGSATKRSKFIKKLRAYGVGEPAIARLVCPIGLPGIGGKDPAVIAAAIAADLLIRAEQARRADRPSPALRAVS